jgi:hypothetical protein
VPPTQNTNAPPQEQHVIASPNPTVDDSKTPAIAPGKISGTKAQPATNTTAAPLKKKATRPKRRRTAAHDD